MTRSRACRLAVLASHPIQYFTPVYRLLAATPGIDVRVMFCDDYGVSRRYDKQFDRAVRWDTEQLAGYDHVFLTNISPVHDTFNPLHAINPAAFTRLLGSFDALWVNGYMYPSNLLAVLAAAMRRTRLLLRSELRLDPRRTRRRWDPLRDRWIRWWVARSDALLYIGTANRDAYLHYGADPRTLHFAPYSIDVDRYGDPVLRNAAYRSDVRRALGIPSGAVVVLYVGKLTQRKHPERMLDVAAWCGADGGHVVMAGSGPLEGALRADIARRQLSNVTMLGFVNQSQLPSIYSLADIFVMPSEREPWGLVLNEAMASGLAAIVSSEVGAAADLIEHGRNGFAIDTADDESLRDAVLMLCRDAGLRYRFGEAGRARAARFSYEATCNGILGALRSLGLLGANDDVSRHSATTCAPV